MFELLEPLHHYWWWDYAKNTFIITIALVAGYSAHVLALRVIQHIHFFKFTIAKELLLARIKLPTRLFCCVLALHIALPLLAMPELWKQRLAAILLQFTIFAVGYSCIALVHITGMCITRHYTDEQDKDPLKARRINTQVTLFVRMIAVTIGILTAIGIATTIPSLKNFGISLFASAGVAGLAIGIASRPVLSNMMAGVQMALTQPIRIDDVVVLEGENGQIEEIGHTYVVVRLWDMRRMIVPLTYFIERPFQNWTHTESNLLGTVLLYVDYTLPLEALRTELHRVLQTTPLWDGNVSNLQVTDLKEGTMEVRILVSAIRSNLFELRCFIREKMVSFLQEKYPNSLPRRRVEMSEKVPEYPIPHSSLIASNNFTN